MTIRPTIHRAALVPLGKDFLAFRDTVIPDWIERNAPGAFVRLYVCDAENRHILVPSRRWEAQAGDVLGIEQEEQER